MNRLISIFLMMAVAIGAVAADKIILRDGRIIPGKIVQVSDKDVMFEANKSVERINLLDIYMLHYEKRGNVYILSDGNRISGEVQKVPRDAEIIYGVWGQETPAYDVHIGSSEISYRISKDAKKAISSNLKVPKNQVFMIVYTDGSRDIITDITVKQYTQPVQSRPEPESEPVVEENPYEVLFHNVARGEMLVSIAERYGVSVDEIIQWNDLPANTRANSKLAAGTQLMLYIPKTK